MSQDITQLRAKVRSTLDRVGNTNGHAMPESSSNVDPILHELFVAAEAESYWKVRHGKAKAAALALVGDELEIAIASVLDTSLGTSISPVTGDVYALNIDIKRPARRVDNKKLLNFLQVECGLSQADVARATEHATALSSPAKQIRVASR